MRNAETSKEDRLNTIRKLNDSFRRGERQDGATLVAPEIRKFGGAFVGLAVDKVKTFEQFDPKVDSEGDHSMGSVLVDGTLVRFEIRYLDLVSRSPASDPADVLSTRRVMVIGMG